MNRRADRFDAESPLNVFVSYAHTDDKYLDEFNQAVKPFVRNGLVDVWSDKKIQASQKWREEIQRAMEEAQVAVLLVSRAFLASDFIMNEELPFLLDAAEDEGVVLLWVPIETCAHETTRLSEIQSVCDPKKPISSKRGNSKAAAWTEIAREVARRAQQPRDDRDFGRSRDDSLIDRVNEATELKLPSPTIRQRSAKGGAPSHLRISWESDGFIEQCPQLVLPEPPTLELLTDFVNRVVPGYRGEGMARFPHVVFVGPSDWTPTGDLHQLIQRERLIVKSLHAYCCPVDLSGLVKQQILRLRNDQAYPIELFVPQQFSERTGKKEKFEDALQMLEEWMFAPHGCFGLILGSFGTGKSFLLRRLCQRLAEHPHPDAPTPLLIELRELGRAKTLDELIGGHLLKHKEPANAKHLRYMVKTGRIALLFDGFDELAQRVTYEKVGSHLDTLLEAASEYSKVLVSSRKQHFLTDADADDRLLRKVELDSRVRTTLRWGVLEPFDHRRIKLFLKNHWRDEAVAERYFNLMKKIEDLIGLSQTPRMLQFITRWAESELQEFATRKQRLAAADLYEEVLKRWLEHDYDKSEVEGAPPTLRVEERWILVAAIARVMWPKLERQMTHAELCQVAGQILPPTDDRGFNAQELAHLAGSRSLLNRDGEGNFYFEHQSILEWFIARDAAQQLKNDARTEELQSPLHPVNAMLSQNELSRLAADFFCELAGHQLAFEWSNAVVYSRGDVDQQLRANAILVASRLKQFVDFGPVVVGTPRLDYSGQDLRGQDLWNADLIGANLSGANLSELIFAGCDLSGANLSQAILKDCDFEHADLSGADLTGADLTRANLLGAKLDGVMGVPKSLWRAKVAWDSIPSSRQSEPHHQAPASNRPASPHDAAAIPNECTDDAIRGGSDSDPDRCDGKEIALPTGSGWNPKLLPCFLSSGSTAQSVAWHPQGDVVASGHDDGSIRLWEATSGRELRRCNGHTGTVFSVSFSPDGASLASGSYDNSVRVWDVASGRELRRCDGHNSYVTSVSFSPDGASLASGSLDNSVRVWDVASGRERLVLRGHRAAVRSVVWHDSGRFIASGSDDGTVKLWDVLQGACVATLFATKNGWAAATPDGRFKYGGDLGGNFWHVLGLVRYEINEVETHFPELVLPLDAPLAPELASLCGAGVI